MKLIIAHVLFWSGLLTVYGLVFWVFPIWTSVSHGYPPWITVTLFHVVPGFICGFVWSGVYLTTHWDGLA